MIIFRWLLIHKKDHLVEGRKWAYSLWGQCEQLKVSKKMYSIIKNAYYVGINHIETAPSYGDAESLIGNSIKKT